MKISKTCRKIFGAALSCLIGLALVVPFQSFPVAAYYNLGTVDLQLGMTTVNLNVGKSTTISAVASPTYSDQTLGCGMEECPQVCGTTCADANGQCQCAGPGYSRYYSAVVATSGNSQIATAKYSGGIITIYGQSVGSTTITVDASLREYTNAPRQTIKVTVTKSGAQSTGGAGASASTGGSTDTGGSAGTANTVSVGGSTTTGNSKASGSSKTTGGSTATGNGSSASAAGSSATSAASGASAASASSDTSAASGFGSSSIATMSGSLGTYDVLQLPKDNVTGKDELTKIQGQDATATFQKKDSSDNVLYSWSFKGTDVKKPADFDMGITFSGENETAAKNLAGGSALVYLNFAHHGSLPGKATVSIRVSDTFKDGQKLYFYYYDPDTKSAKLMSSGVKVVNGYANVDITHCSSYFLSVKAIGAQNSGLPVWAIVVIVLAALAGAYFAGYWAYRHFLQKGMSIPPAIAKLYAVFPSPAKPAAPQHEQEAQDAAGIF